MCIFSIVIQSLNLDLRLIYSRLVKKVHKDALLSMRNFWVSEIYLLGHVHDFNGLKYSLVRLSMD